MEKITQRDREILREIAGRKLAMATCAKNDEIVAKWKKQAAGVRDTPTVRLLFSNFRGEVIDSRLRCEGADARRLESQLLSSLVGRELFDDDTPLSTNFEIPIQEWASPFGTSPKRVKAKDGMGFHIEPLTDDIEADFDIFCKGNYWARPTETRAWAEYADEIFGDILPSHIVQSSLGGMLTNPLVALIGMENYYMSMYDSPETLHKIMEMGTKIYEDWYDYLENNKLLLPCNNFSPLYQESFAFTDELPESGEITSTKQVWGFLESQETTAVSPETYGEFVYPYQDRLVKRFGLLSYGCCERVDDIWEDYLSKWDNLRKLSVSPFNNEERVGEYLRGTRVVYYSKPRAEQVTNRGPLDEEYILNYFKGVAKAASGCLFEVAQREVGTIYGDFERGRRYVELAKQAIADAWQA